MEKLGSREIDVVVAGHLCLDITPVFIENGANEKKHVFTPGQLTNMSGVKVAAAGAVANVGISLGKLGMETLLMGKTGKDFFGSGIENYLKEWKVRTKMSEALNGSTSYTIVLSPPGVDRIFFHFPGANDLFNADDIDYDVVKKTRLFHFGYPPLMKSMYENDGGELVKIFRRAKEAGTITSLDMAFTEPSSESGKADWEKILKAVLPFVDIYIPSIEETLYMLRRDYFNEINTGGENMIHKLDLEILPELGEELLSLGAKIVAIKCGVKGYYIRTQCYEILADLNRLAPIDLENWSDRELLVETYDVRGIKSTTGAGDCSIAGFLTAFLKGRTIEDTVKAAHAVATQSILAYDVFSNIKDFAFISELIKDNSPFIKMDIKSSYWRNDENSGIWIGRKDVK